MPLELRSALLRIFWNAGRQMLALYPYVVGGAVLATLLRNTRWMGLLRRSATGSPTCALFAAAGLGALSPLCTYGTVPLVLGLERDGVSIGVLLAFLSTSSLMNPQLFVLTWGGLGPGMALMRLASVLVFGVSFGMIAGRLPVNWVSRTCLPHEQRSPSQTTSPGHHASHEHGRGLEIGALLRGTWDELTFVSYYLAIGVLLGALVDVVAPTALVRGFLGRPGWLAVSLAALLAVPLYACGGGTIPLVRTLLDQGMSRGAALAFFVAGPATRIPPLLALATLLRPAFVALYVIAVLAFSVVVGFLYGA